MLKVSLNSIWREMPTRRWDTPMDRGRWAVDRRKTPIRPPLIIGKAAAIPMMIETHAGEDVAAYARGPGANGIHGVMDQNELYGVMRAVTLNP
ncbi:MAG: hypothetical protein Ct9H300mP8_13170 [Gammaproteobacteria bacterium]|nr:MAG: hypothetical protein Ct9H300mP8_13170 [Gammaproteobacteria bacterium]